MKCDFNDEMSKILGIYRCDRFIELIEDIYEIVRLYNVDEVEDWVADTVGWEDVRNVRLARTAYLLSKLADRHHRWLRSVNRAAPGFWKRAEKFTKPLALEEASEHNENMN